MEQWTTRHSMLGTPQGGIISPLLANIYLHELDRYMERSTSIEVLD
jgi:RNA-directed DNA polymerase